MDMNVSNRTHKYYFLSVLETCDSALLSSHEDKGIPSPRLQHTVVVHYQLTGYPLSRTPVNVSLKPQGTRVKPKSSGKARVRGSADSCPAGAFDPNHRAVRWEKDKSLLLRQAKRPRQQS